MCVIGACELFNNIRKLMIFVEFFHAYKYIIYVYVTYLHVNRFCGLFQLFLFLCNLSNKTPKILVSRVDKVLTIISM